MVRQHHTRAVQRSRLLLAVMAGLLASTTVLAQGDEPPAPSPAEEAAPEAEAGSDEEEVAVEDYEAVLARCGEQEPQAFLIRGNYVRRSGVSAEERAERSERHEATIRYRTEQYGYFEGFGDPDWNESTPSDNAEYTRFAGLRVQLNRRIIPALHCAEAEIARSCGDVPYQPSRLSGLRTRNTFRGGEVSNHVYGIAIDIDPSENTCCGCVARWADHPLCQIEVDSIFERMIMPECWVHAFERYGFYWLGHDALQDTMHFEFLADPEGILREPEPEAAPFD